MKRQNISWLRFNANEMPLFDGGPNPASVRAVEDIFACFINKHDFRAVCRQHPDLALEAEAQ